MTCGTCSEKVLDVFCVASCKTYYLAFCTSLATDDTTGECARPIEDTDKCVHATADAGPSRGNSGHFQGCLTSSTYLQDYVCVTCLTGTGYIDFLGINCLIPSDCTDT